MIGLEADRQGLRHRWPPPTAHGGFGFFATHPQTADQRHQASPIAGRGDDGVGLKARAVGEDDIRPLEVFDGGADLDLSPLYRLDEAVVYGRPDAPLTNA